MLREEPMSVRRLGVAAFVLSCQLLCLDPANAQKQGGTLRIYHRDNPPSASLHEEFDRFRHPALHGALQ